MPRPLVGAALVLLALTLSAPAVAHVEADPPFLPTGSSTSIEFAGPNERSRPMVGFSITVPPGLTIEHAHEATGWVESGDSRTATWTGGSLAPDGEIRFGATIAADTEPGSVEVIARQLYTEGEPVRWTVQLMISQPESTPSQNLAIAGIVALIGVLVVGAVAMLAWRRRTAA